MQRTSNEIMIIWCTQKPGPKVLNILVLNSAEDEIFSANKYENANAFEIFMLSYVKQKRTGSNFRCISSTYSMLS